MPFPPHLQLKYFINDNDNRKEKDKSGGECFAADVAVNSDWFSSTMEPSEVFTAFVITVAMEGKIALKLNKLE